jgi:hypothetical protein
VAEDGVPDLGFWIQKTGDEPIVHFIKPGYLTNYVYNILGGGYVYERTFFLDDECHHDFAEKHLPRAVRYSAGLLNYFFRGTIAETLTNSGHSRWLYQDKQQYLIILPFTQPSLATC